ncbi:hypothetical protein ACFWAX_33720 [Streptomyces sp. NPDC059956]|uniref:hypothetical protein n=1 Tax=Streptomyces sp. NPDC059956 TaxID=3347015 RepID=UPI00366516F6
MFYPDSSGEVYFKAEGRVLGDRLYGRPVRWITVVHLAAPGVAALGVLVLLSAVPAAMTPARRRP